MVALQVQREWLLGGYYEGECLEATPSQVRLRKIKLGALERGRAKKTGATSR